jgi:hypothetical protein
MLKRWCQVVAVVTDLVCAIRVDATDLRATRRFRVSASALPVESGMEADC